MAGLPHSHSTETIQNPCSKYHWVQSKRHRLWFSMKTCSCYSMKTRINSMILILKLNLTSLRNIYTLKCVWCLAKTTFNVYVSQQSQIQFKDKDHAVYMSFR